MGTALHLDVSHQGMRQGRLIFVWSVRRRGQPPLSDERGAVPPAQGFFPCTVSGSRERNGGGGGGSPMASCDCSSMYGRTPYRRIGLRHCAFLGRGGGIFRRQKVLTEFTDSLISDHKQPIRRSSAGPQQPRHHHMRCEAAMPRANEARHGEGMHLR